MTATSRRLTILALLALAPTALATHQRDNLRDLKPADLCPPSAQVSLGDGEDEDFSALVQDALDRYTGAWGLKWGDPEKCGVDQILTLDAYEDRGSFVYVAEFALEPRGDTVVQQGARRLRVKAPRLWGNLYYGTYDTEFQDIATREIRDLYEGFLSDWTAAHRK
ncbi:hypothetical protein [Deinococcus pimensis]|uniref:hypothetical protein n=1 Tax=Deinococcus pimensis TaxID=309888 RepID=UPI000480E569|nr:hypothetical protein [Deinococcus pimensis]